MQKSDAASTPRVAFATLGCKVNQSEVQRMAEDLSARGYRVVPQGHEADVCVINTCTVTHVADRKSRQMIRRIRRSAPTAYVIVTGCYAEVSAVKVDDGADLFVGTADKDRLVDLVAERFPIGYRLNNAAAPREDICEPREESSRTRAFVKIQDGCDDYCTYCIVPAARGRPRSVSLEDVLRDVRTKLESGHREIVLTGVNVAKYGLDFTYLESVRSLGDLIQVVLDDLGVERLRITSIEPQDFDPRLLEVWADPRLARHFHLPLQSGCDATLARMGRGYTIDRFAAIVRQIRDRLPDAGITTDLIVGFPGETEDEFAESCSFLRYIGFSRIHVFPYSLRSGTPAAEMPGQVSPQVKKERAEIVRGIGLETSRLFRQSFVGREMTVLWEQAESTGQIPLWTGLTDNYIKVRACDSRNLGNTLTKARLLSLDGEGMKGQVIQQDDTVGVGRSERAVAAV